MIRVWRRIGHRIAGHPQSSLHLVMGRWFCGRCGAKLDGWL